MDSDNLTKQIEEVEALSSIYGEDWTTESEASRSYNIRIKENDHEVVLYVTMPPEYPELTPPKYELSAPWMDRKQKEKLHISLDEVYLENVGETVIYQWVEKIRETLLKIKPKETTKKTNTTPTVDEVLDLTQLEITCPEITHGEVIIDRKSSFQGHAAEVHSVNDVNAVLAKLKQNKKILNATHNMYAYRIERKTDKGVTMIQDCDDDGETHAGGKDAAFVADIGPEEYLSGGIQMVWRHSTGSGQISTHQQCNQAGDTTSRSVEEMTSYQSKQMKV